MKKTHYQAGCNCGGTGGCMGHIYDDEKPTLSTTDGMLLEIIRLLGKIHGELETLRMRRQ